MARDSNIFGGKRFIGNTNPTPKIVHDLEFEDTGETGCQINEILVGHIKTFDPDTLDQAKIDGFKPCEKCLERGDEFNG